MPFGVNVNLNLSNMSLASPPRLVNKLFKGGKIISYIMNFQKILLLLKAKESLLNKTKLLEPVDEILW